MDSPTAIGERRLPVLVLIAVVAAVAALLAGCGDGDDDDATTSTASTSTTAGDDAWLECEQGDGVYIVEQPPDWETNDAGVLPTCSLFDPEPVEVEPGTEIPFDIAVTITVEDVPAERITEGQDRGQEVLDERQEQVDGRMVIRIETRATSDAPLAPEGMRTTRWIVPIDGRTIVARTHDVGDLPYDEKQQVLGRMVESLQIDGTTTTTEPPADQGARPVAPGGTEPVASPGFPSGSSSGIAHLTDVRAAEHTGFTRVVFEFDAEEAPSHRVEYVEPPVREAGSGHAVDVAGSAFVEIQMAGATGVRREGETPEETYTGPDRIDLPDSAVVEEVVHTGDFEAHLSWAVGLEERVPFAVETLQDPARLVVDFIRP